MDDRFNLPVEKLHVRKVIRTSPYLLCISNPERDVVKAEKPALLVLRTRKGCFLSQRLGFYSISTINETCDLNVELETVFG